MNAENTTTTKSKNINLKIVQKVIELTTKKGYPLKDKNLNGFAQAFAKDELNIVYTARFSGAEILPGHRAYIVDIWYKHKKVYNIDFQDIDELSGCGRRPKGVWLDKLMELKL
ncbi:hypothetical protein [Paraglaciecola sp. L1A13]|uniref:hypothetical protein n=1 Tax=Paraglaciecola sp. L1A13 TaxID=2686359 RepID=UPI00131BBF6D|nr:hypothetical protein [Paraglaciecola sp. L1A13]